MAEITGKPMSVIVNWFALLIIFVFDPLAVSLVIAFNTALKIDKGEDDKKKIIRKLELYGDDLSENITETNDKVIPSELAIDIEMSPEEELYKLNEMGEPLVRATLDKSIIDKKPYYEHPAFDWSLKKYWINDQAAVKYWMTNIKGN
jgi:hypothetical protein